MNRISRLDNISRSSIYGGRKREIRVEIDPLLMKGFDVSIEDIENTLIQLGYPKDIAHRRSQVPKIDNRRLKNVA